MIKKIALIALLVCLAAPAFAEEDADFVPLGGHYKGGSNFNSKTNPYAYMPTSGSISEISKKQYRENREAYTKQATKQGPKAVIKPQLPLLNPIDQKKAKCLTGNYDSCR